MKIYNLSIIEVKSGVNFFKIDALNFLFRSCLFQFSECDVLKKLN
jgi:hypothetical protein